MKQDIYQWGAAGITMPPPANCPVCGYGAGWSGQPFCQGNWFGTQESWDQYALDLKKRGCRILQETKLLAQPGWQ
jgi:hypothetical protein